MPIHDWTKVRAGTFHHFHQRWVLAIADVLNTGGLPPGYFAMAEQIAGGPEPDVITLGLDPRPGVPAGGMAVDAAPPRTRFVVRTEAAAYAGKANRLTVRHPDGDVIAVVEIVSPGNKDSRHAIRAFARKAEAFLRAKIHLLVVDPFPPTRRDPQGIHKVIWDRLRDEPFELPPDKRLTLASYSAGGEVVAYVEPVAVGDALADMPLFLTPDRYVPCPLEATYQAAWATFPAVLKGQLEAPPA